MICNVKGIPMYYEEYGKGTPILFIHGYLVDHRLMTGCFEPVFNKLSGYRRIYIDLPGMGKSPAPSWLKNADDMLDVVIEFTKNVIGDDAFLVAGESYGGYMALGLLHKMKSKINGVFFLCPVIESDYSKRILPTHRLLHKDDSFTPPEEFLSMAVVSTPQIYAAFEKNILPSLEIADKEFTERYRKEGYALSFDNALRDLVSDVPAAFLLGRQDAITGYADALALIENFPRATFAVMDCTGHNLQIENEALFAAHVVDWLRRVSYET
ncbi:MAG: alpha/beta hydrolase [Defluviitaleaceae bacterium]|nr:alpha/beta hydrolase [Defluviitaleaceae bacterium]